MPYKKTKFDVLRSWLNGKSYTPPDAAIINRADLSIRLYCGPIYYARFVFNKSSFPKAINLTCRFLKKGVK